jgi:hypothetical protein
VGVGLTWGYDSAYMSWVDVNWSSRCFEPCQMLNCAVASTEPMPNTRPNCGAHHIDERVPRRHTHVSLGTMRKHPSTERSAMYMWQSWIGHQRCRTRCFAEVSTHNPC